MNVEFLAFLGTQIRHWPNHIAIVCYAGCTDDFTIPKASQIGNDNFHLLARRMHLCRKTRIHFYGNGPAVVS